MLDLRAAILAPFPYWLWIVAVGVGPMILVAAISRDLMILAGICTMLLKIYIFGRILSQVLSDGVSSFWAILREYGGHYWIAAILVGLIALALRMVLAGDVSLRNPYGLASGVARGAVTALTIYVWPLVFLKRSSVEGILAGVSVLIGNFVSSLWIIGIALFGEAVLTVGQLFYVDHRSGWGFAVLLIARMVYIYLAAVAFAAALHRLLGVRIVEPTADAQR